MKTHWKYNWKLGKWDQLLRLVYVPPSYRGSWYTPGGMYFVSVW